MLKYVFASVHFTTDPFFFFVSWGGKHKSMIWGQAIINKKAFNSVNNTAEQKKKKKEDNNQIALTGDKQIPPKGV